MDQAVECKYRGKLIGFLIGDRYLKHEVSLGGNGRRIRRNWPDGAARENLRCRLAKLTREGD